MAKSTQSAFQLRRILPVLLMCACLLFLTSANFFIYPVKPVSGVSHSKAGQSDSEENSSTPVEEKSTCAGNAGIQEEYLHEKHSFGELAYAANLVHDRILEAEKLQVVHYELHLPPPKA